VSDDNRWYYFRATVDISTQSESLARRLRAGEGGEGMGRALLDSIRDGRTELDAVENVEDHGGSE
jgi:hypothetical protein